MMQVSFLKYLQQKLDIPTEILADFLFIDKRTLYNYNKYTIENLPNKVQEKFIIFFLGFDCFIAEQQDMVGVFQILEQLDDNTLHVIKNAFIETAKIRRRNYIITSTKELIKKTDTKRNVESLDEFLADFKTLVEYSNLSKGYLYTLFEIIITKVESNNDYQFLDYINKYKRSK